MAGEFTKHTENNLNIWTCCNCAQDIVSQAKPRSHVCLNQEEPVGPEAQSTANPIPGSTSAPNTPFHPRGTQNGNQFNAPPPGFNVPPAPTHGYSGEMEALLRFQMLQAEQNKQMMMFLQQQNQEMHQMQQEQNELKMNQMMEMIKIQKTETKVKCPRWEKEENVKSFVNRLRRWNDVEKGRGKYLQLLEALQDSGRKREKQRVELEEQNGLINPDNENIIKTVIERLEKWFGKTKVDEASEAWKSFKDMKRSSGENLDEFLLRFETVESKLKCSAVELPNLILALQLLESVNVNSDQRRHILVHVKIENTDTVYDDMKSSIRLMKGSLVENNPNFKLNDAEEEEVNFTKNENFRRFRSRSKSKQRFEDRSFDSDRKNFYKDRRNSKERGRSRERYQSQERAPYRKQRSYSKNRDYSQDRNKGRESRQSYESVNLLYKETGDEAQIETKENHGKMIVDSGTTKTVAGVKWMNEYLESLSPEEQEKIEKHSEERFFRFGNSVRYPSKQAVEIPIKLGSLEAKLHVSLVDASIPLLLGKPDLKQFGFIINFEEETVFTTRTHEIFPLETTVNGHLALPITNENILEDDIFLMNDCDRKEKEKKVTKIHKVLAHPHPNILKQFFKNSSENEKEVLEAVGAVTERCEVCRRFRKSPSRPKVGLPVSNDFNDCVALDLKERKGNKGYILYCICTFSRLTRGVLIKNKHPETIVSGIIDCWVLGKDYCCK